MPKTEEVLIGQSGYSLSGNLIIPSKASAVVLFAHGSGSSRLSPRNKFVADELNKAGMATFLIDLLTPEEELVDIDTRHYRFDISLLAERLIVAIHWLRLKDAVKEFPIGLFGASTGTAAAIVAAVKSRQVTALVSRGGRPDLAGVYLPLLRSPTLFIVGSADDAVIDINVRATQKMDCLHGLEIVPGATHRFEETGAIEQVAELACAWFAKYIAPFPGSIGSQFAPMR